MRSTRASAAVARLNARTKEQYTMARTGDGLFYIRLRVEGGSERVFDPLPLDDFVQVVDAMGPQSKRRMTKNDVAFQKQLGKKVAE
jgi:hypothetical protein